MNQEPIAICHFSEKLESRTKASCFVVRSYPLFYNTVWTADFETPAGRRAFSHFFFFFGRFNRKKNLHKGVSKSTAHTALPVTMILVNVTYFNNQF